MRKRGNVRWWTTNANIVRARGPLTAVVPGGEEVVIWTVLVYHRSFNCAIVGSSLCESGYGGAWRFTSGWAQARETLVWEVGIGLKRQSNLMLRYSIINASKNRRDECVQLKYQSRMTLKTNTTSRCLKSTCKFSWQMDLEATYRWWGYSEGKYVSDNNEWIERAYFGSIAYTNLSTYEQVKE